MIRSSPRTEALRYHSRMHPKLAPAVLLVLALGLAACVPAETVPSACADASVTLRTTLADGQLDPANLDVCRDQHVTLVVTVQEAGIFHLHGYDEEAPETEVHPGDTLTLEFDAVAGQFPIELHSLDESEEVTIGTLTVHEP